MERDVGAVRLARLVDWNSTLGTLTVCAIMLAVCGAWALWPGFFDEDDWRGKVVPYVAPAVVLFMLWQLVIYVEIGPRLVFRGALGKRSYDWSQVRGIVIEEDTNRFFYGLLKFRHEYMKFTLEHRGKLDSYAYRVSKRHRERLLEALAAHSPYLQ